ncbi:hypothetical protein SUGI_1024730 [Cryptomeria japonica]|nr:hypothetical protein SUGI_1024730 [Cryptomeria japonica]
MLRNLEHLVLKGSSAYWIEESESEWRMLNSLKHLVLRGRNPEWRELVIQGANLSISLRKLTNLRVLVLRDCTLSGELALNGIGSVSTNFESSINSCMGSSLVIMQMSNVKQTSKVSISGKHCPRLGSLQLVSMESLVELNITGVTTPFFLELENCKRLKRVSGELDLAELVIFDCPKFEALPSLANSNFLEKISVDKCWSLNEEVNAPATLKYLHCYSGPELINSFFSNRKALLSWTMPSKLTSIIGKAVHGAEATLNAAFFSGLLNPDEINEIRMKRGRPEASLKVRDSLGAIIVCAVIRSTVDGQVVRIRLQDGKSICCSVEKGEWVWSIAISHPEHMYFADSRIAESCWIPTMDYPLLDSVIKGYVCTIDKGREPFQLFSKIISQLYRLNKLDEMTAAPVNSKHAAQKPSVSGSRGFRNKILKSAIFGFQHKTHKRNIH